MKRTALILSLSVLMTGCIHPRTSRTTLPPETGNPHLLYLQPAPHRGLYVEVDAVEGAEPSDEELSNLKSFLEQWCEKPEGITLCRSSVIARSAARGKGAVSLARQFLAGPVGISSAAEPASRHAAAQDPIPAIRQLARELEVNVRTKIARQGGKADPEK